MKLSGKVAIVTGGAQGMGRAICLRYAQEGARVVVSDLNLTGAQSVVDEITRAEGQAVAVQVDVRDPEQVQRMVDTTVEQFGGLDILVNNAGVGKIIPFLETTAQDWNFMFDINC
jgi:NAD(P)-dependent dehydrogenase (short-subunit alcohol dehydrogenase family)